MTGIKHIAEIYVKSLSLLPESPSQSPPIDSRSGGLGVCTHSLDGMKPSLVVQGASAGLEKAVVHTPPGYSLCVGSGHNAVASFACIVAAVAAAAAVVVVAVVVGVVGVVVVVAVVDGDAVAVAVAGGDAVAVAAAGYEDGAVGAVGVAHVACVLESSPVLVHSEARSKAQLHVLVRSPSAHFVVSKTHDLVSLIVDNMLAGQAYTAHSVSKLIPASGDRSALRSHLPRMVGSYFPVDESGVSVS